MGSSPATRAIAARPTRLRIKGWERHVKNFWRKWTRAARGQPESLLPESWDPGEAARPVRPDQLRFPAADVTDANEHLLSCLCRAEFLQSPAFRYWADQLRENWRLHRKLWEFCYVCQALYERDMLRDGRQGLGFAVGQEPLPSLFAARGCRVVATDLPADDERCRQWADTAQWTDSLQVLNERGLCEPAAFRERVRYRPVDMNHIPSDLRGFDFTWSSCSFEHCGSIELGRQFLINQMECLRPGGVAVHTTELNVTSNEDTLREGVTVIFRRRDLDEMAAALRGAGHTVEPLELDFGDTPADRHVDLPPYPQQTHLRLRLANWTTTSVGLIITKRAA